MEWQTLFLFVLGMVCALLGWFGSELWKAVQSLRKDLSLLEVQISRDYVRYDRMQDAIRPVMEELAAIRKLLQEKKE